jgi:hypothetical protein
MKHNEAIDRARRKRYVIGGAEFGLGVKSVDWQAVQDAWGCVDRDSQPKPESKRKAKARLRARKHALKILREQGAREYHVAGDGDCMAQVIMY